MTVRPKNTNIVDFRRVPQSHVAAPMPQPPRPTPQIINAKRRAENAIATFSKEYANLRKMLGAEAGKDISADSTNYAMLRAFLNVVLNAVPVAEEQYLRGGSVNSAYALSTLINQAREIGRDLAAKSSAEGQVQHIINEIIWPAIRLIMQQQINQLVYLRQTIENQRDDPTVIKDSVDHALRGISQILTDAVKRMDSQIRHYLLEVK